MRRQVRFVQAHVFCRHGDRTPGANFFEPQGDLAGKEVAAWLTELLTVQNTRKLYAAFPLRVERGQRRPRDEALGVFGSLTHRGLRQMRSLGASLRAHYDGLLPAGAVDFGDVDCTSSNYRRTMHSAQALLGGLLPQFYDIYSAPEIMQPLGFHEIDTDGDGWVSGPEFEAAMAKQQAANAMPSVAVHVPRLDQAYINVYPLIPEIAKLMRSLKRDTTAAEEQEECRVQAELEEHIPAFAFNIRPFSWSQALDLLTSRVSRLHSSHRGQGRRALLAADGTIEELFRLIDKEDVGEFGRAQFHAACAQLFRDALSEDDMDTCFDVILAAGGDAGGGGAAEAAAAAGGGGKRTVVDYATWQRFFCGLQGTYEGTDELNLRHLLASHLQVVERVVCRTFARWYSHRRLLELVVGRMHRAVVPPMAAAATAAAAARATGRSGVEEATATGEARCPLTPLVLHVGHDVTIVPLLCALRGWTEDHKWPKYAAAVRLDCFEEVTPDTGRGQGLHGGPPPRGKCADGGGAASVAAVAATGRFFVHATYAEGFDALSQDESGENFTPTFVPILGDRPVSPADSECTAELVQGGKGHAEATPLPAGFEAELLSFEEFDQMLACRTEDGRG